MHFRNRAGKWQAIDTDLVATGDRYRNRANSFTVRLPRRLGPGAVRFSDRDAWLSFSLNGAKARADVSGTRARYERVLPGVDAVYTSEPSALKEELILTSPDATRSFTFDLHMAGGLRPRLADTGAVDILDRRGDVRLRMAAPVMMDADDARSDRFDVRLAARRDGWSLTLAPDQAWLDDPARRWPVVIDPVVTRGAEHDCTVSSESARDCASATLTAGTRFVAVLGETLEWRSLLRFDVASAVPANAQVTDARLALRMVSKFRSGADTLSVHPMLTPWWGSSSAGWPTCSCGPAADTISVGGSGAVYYRWNVSQLTRDWLAGTVANNGVMVRDPDGVGFSVTSFASSEASDASQRPYLEITYRPPPVIGTPSGPLWTRRTQSADHRQEGLYDKLYGVTVTATAGGSGVRTIAFSVINSAGGTVISSPDPSPQSCTSLCSKTRSFTLDTDTVPDGMYTIRVTATDQLGVSSSLSWTVTVDRRGDIYTADEYVNSQAWLAATDWAKLAPRYARRTAQTYIKTREPREVRVRTRATDYDSTDEEAFWVRRSDRDEDPNLEPVAEIINQRDRTNGAAWTTVETGSLVAALEPWQFAPPANGGQFERRQLVADGMIHDVWRDTATKLPVKRTVRDASNGSLVVTRFWSYAVGRMTDAEAPTDLFHVARPAVVGQEEEEDFTSVSPAAAMFVEDEETGATFRPQSLGRTVKLDSGDYCMAGTITHHSRLFGESARGWDPEGDPLPDEDQGYPGRAAPSTRVDVYYVPRQGRRCKSQDDVVLDTPPIVVLSMAAESSEAAAWTGHFTREAQQATENPLARGGAFAGAEPVTLDSGPSMAYVIKSDRSAQNSFLLRAGDTTVMVRGPLTAEEVPGLATTMEAM